MSEATREYASFLPQDADQSGFLDGVTATIVSVRATTFDYNGNIATPVPAIAVTYQPEGGKESVQHYTAGKPDHRVPSDDGLRFKVFGGKKGLPKDCNALAWVLSVINAGFPTDKLGSGDDFSVFDNTVVKLRSEAQPKRDTKDGNGGEQKDRTIVLVDQIVTLPWDNKGTAKATASGKPAGAKPAAAKAAKPAQAAPAAVAAGNPLEDMDAIDAATNAVVEILKSTNPIPKNKVGPLSFRLLANSPHRLNATKLLTVNLTDFAELAASSFSFDGEQITPAAA